MKKLIPILLMAIFMLATIFFSATKAGAQTTLTQTSTAGVAKTTHTNADTSYHSIDLAGNTNNFNILTFTVKGTKTLGTVGGTVTLWGSNDNSRWFAVYGASTAAMSDTVTTQSLADSDNDKVFLVTGTRFRYYRVKVITSGTQVSTYVCKLLARKVAN